MAKKSQLDKAIQQLTDEMQEMTRAWDVRCAEHQAAMDAKCGAIDTLEALQRKVVRKPKAAEPELVEKVGA